jgi:fibronectin type 3 domain-containing protein
MTANLSRKLPKRFRTKSLVSKSGRRRAFQPQLERLEIRELPSAAPLIQVSSNGRYLVTSSGQPFYLVGDSAWGLANNLSETDANTYFTKRASQGFNTAMFDVAENTAQLGGIPIGNPADTNGDLPFLKNLDGTAATASSNTWDVTTPNPTYWSHIDNLVKLAAAAGLQVEIDPYDNYSAYLSANSTTSLNAYGQFLGSHYAASPNVIWMLGNDYKESSQGDADMGAMAAGIKAKDPTHLMTLETWYNTSAPNTSFTEPALKQYMTIDGVYWYNGPANDEGSANEGPFRTEYLTEYNRNAGSNGVAAGPMINIESYYEGTSTGTSSIGPFMDPQGIRYEDYTFLLNGASGDQYGNNINTFWQFNSGWQQEMTTPGAQQMTYFVNLEQSVAWQNLVPDQNGTVFVGVGSPAEYSGAYTPDGTLAIAYKAETGTGSQSFTVNMGHFVGPVTAQSYDPANGTYTTISTNLANSGTMTFNSPSTNSAGQNDFVLVLKAAPATQAPGAPTLSAIPGSNSVALSWSASGGATIYSVYRGTSKGGEGSTAIATVSTTSYADSAVSNGTTYWYVVKASNSVGTSGPSNEVSATPTATEFMGETNILGSDDSGNAGLLLAQQATLAQAGTLQSLSFYVTQAAGNLRLGVYDASGPNGGPGKLLAQTNTFTPVVGWNTAAVTTPVALAAGTYWLAYEPTDNNLHFAVDRTSGSIAWYSFTFGPMPATFSTSTSTQTAHWSFYATLTEGATATPPSITTQPASVTVNAGQSASFSVTAGGTVPLTYQWQQLVGSTWTNVGSNSATFTISSAATANAGSYRVTVSNAAGSVTSNTATLTVNQPSLPSPWQDTDIGSPAKPGSGSATSGTFTVAGGGGDIWNTSDQFNFVYEPLNGDGTIVARVASQQNTNVWAKAGVMIRESLAANSTDVYEVVTPGNGDAFQYRTTTGGSAAWPGSSISGTAPEWVKLVRSGSTFTGYVSADGTNWTLAGTITISMAANVYVGLAVTAHDNTQLNTSTFTNVSVTKAVATAPSITTQPSSLTVTAGQSASFSVAAGGTAPLSYQWQKQISGTWTAISGATAASYTISATANTDAGSYRVLVTNSAGTATSNTVTLTVNPAAVGSLVVAIDAGGVAAGSFVADTNVSATVGNNGTYQNTDAINTSKVANPAPQAVYDSERWGDGFTYTVPNLTAAATYTVRLGFAEIWYSAAGQRQFNVSINGTQVLSNFDIFATAGGKDIAVAESFGATANSSGQIVFQFVNVAGGAKVSGIEILIGPQAAKTMGQTNVLPTDDSGNANLLLAQKATLSQAGALQSLAFYVTQAAGSLVLGVYDAGGPNGGPGKLLATTSSFTPSVGWNTVPVTTSVALAAGTYWLAYLPSDNSLHFRVDQTSGTLEFYSFAFGAMPGTFSTTPTMQTGHWSFYATLT